MKITKVNIPESGNDGLKSIEMNRLEEVVLLAGKNGAGKTRILNKIFSFLEEKPVKTLIENAKVQQIQNKKHLSDIQQELFSANTQRPKVITESEEYAVRAQFNVVIEDLAVKKRAFENEIRQIDKDLDWKYIETSEAADKYPSVWFVPKELNLSDPNQYTKQNLKKLAQKLGKESLEDLAEACLPKIQYVQDFWFNSTHPKSNFTVDNQTLAEENYNRLNNLIENFLGTSLGRSNEGEATLFDMPISQSNKYLSEGQKILLQVCIAIYAQHVELDNLILILDEPENHLHPSIIREVIDKILTVIKTKKGQIWIATHSIPLLAHFDPQCIWYVEGGSIKFAGQNQEDVLKSLLGNEDELYKLQDFINLPAQLAAIQYSIECLLPPAVLLTGPHDPQTLQIREIISDLVSEKQNLKILDYGAGKGRLILDIAEQDSVKDQKLIDMIEYVAYDEFDSDKEECKNSLVKAYGNSNKKYYNNLNDLLTEHDANSFHLVILCNVLHEIDSNDWLSLFILGGKIDKMLMENGFLLIVEDQRIPTGEKAHLKGFSVLDTAELIEMFKIKVSTDTNFRFSDYRKDNRLKAHLIPKDCLLRITHDSRKRAFISLSDRAKDEIKKLRKDESTSYKSGKLHGFWTQQFANAQLWLEQW